MEFAAIVAEMDGVTLTQPQIRGDYLRHQDGVARGAGEGVGVAVNHAVKLFAATRGEEELALRNFSFGKADGGEMALAIGSEEFFLQEPRPAVLKLVAFLAEAGNAFVGRAYALDLVADVLRVVPGEDANGAGGIRFAGDRHRNLPLVARLSGTRARNLRTVDDAALAAGFCTASALLVASA